LTTAFAAALYLKKQNFSKKVYYIGLDGIEQELAEVNIKSFGKEHSNLQYNEDEMTQLALDPEVHNFNLLTSRLEQL
jgi:ribonucleotide monophosphatase NagD (HAD superfamily)